MRTAKLGLFQKKERYCTEIFSLPEEVNIGKFLMRMYPLQPDLPLIRKELQSQCIIHRSRKRVSPDLQYLLCVSSAPLSRQERI